MYYMKRENDFIPQRTKILKIFRNHHVLYETRQLSHTLNTVIFWDHYVTTILRGGTYRNS